MPIQLCGDGTSVQLCGDGTSVQLCSGVPDTCPDGLDDEYDVTVCGVTVTVSRPEGNTDCLWQWTVGGETGCGINIDQVYLELDAGNSWAVWVEQGSPAVPDYERCDYEKTTGNTPVGDYENTAGTGGASCGTSATVEEAAP